MNSSSIRTRSGMSLAVLIGTALMPADAPQARPPSTPCTNEVPGRVRYEASWYAQFSPRTALDMVAQTPGFTPGTAEGGTRRGFSGAVGNVLIDGARPSAKSQTLSDILQLIPAKQVACIEILRGAEVAGDPSGEAVLANVVRDVSVGAGAWSAGIEYADRREPAPKGALSWSDQLGVTDYAFRVSSNSFRHELLGTRRIEDASGAVTGLRTDTLPREFAEYAVNAEMARPAFGGSFAVTGQAHVSRNDDHSMVRTTSQAGEVVESQVTPSAVTTHTYEAGLSFDRGLGAWDLALVALLTRKRTDSDASSTHCNSEAVVDSVSTQAQTRDSGESIVRVSASRNFGEHRVQAGLEGALNTLDARTNLALDLGEGPTAIHVPNANLQVEESRGETFAGYTWRPSGPWSLETRLSAEVSHLGFTGDVDQSVDLLYWKPLLQITRAFGERNQLQLRMFRDVGQLDFSDFISAASLADDRVNGGNPGLRPDTSWRAELAADLRIGADAAFGIQSFHYWFDDAVGFVPMGPPGRQIDAPANIGSATVSGLSLTGSMPVQWLVPGGTVGVAATVQGSEVTDPITGEPRTMSEFDRDEFSAEFRQDVVAQNFAWGINYSQTSASRTFRLAEISSSRSNPSLDLFVETTAIATLKVRLSASVLDAPELNQRTLFEPDRTGAIAAIESGERRFGKRWNLSLSGTL